MDYNYYYYDPSDHHNYHVDLPPSYYPPHNSCPSYDQFAPQFTSSYYAPGFGQCSESFLIDPAGDSPRFVVSYSTSPEFKEYDPTLYAGGYDPSTTYGVPLAPSEEICYPRSTQVGTISVLQVPLGEAHKIPEDVQGEQESDSNKDKKEEPDPVIIQDPPLGNTNITVGDPKERESVVGTEESGYGSTPEHVPYQSSPSVDLCDGIFGHYWPCWEREVNRKINGEMGNHHHYREGGYWAGGRSSQDWQIRTADYLFGSSNPYENDDHTEYVNASVYSGNWI